MLWAGIDIQLAINNLQHLFPIYIDLDKLAPAITGRSTPNMRRAHAGQFYEPVPTNVDHGDILEEENEKMTALLRDKIHDLKAVTLEIGNEVKYQDKLLNNMADDFDRTGGFLKNTMNRVVRLGKGSHNHYILYLFIFSFSVFFTLWLVLKMR